MQIDYNKEEKDMCRFRSGILLKDRAVIAQKDNDSHQDMLEELNISDTYENAARVFVRAELIPEKEEWWTDPDGWEFVIDQDIVPDWFEEDREGHISRFREAVKEWWSGHVLVDKKIDTLRTGYYMLKDCEVEKLCGDAMVLLKNSKVGEMWDSSQVGVMFHSSQVGEMWDGSQVGEMRDGSQVREMWGSSQVRVMYGSSQVGVMRDGSQVGKMHDSSQVGGMYNSAQVREMHGNSQVREMYGSAQVREMWGNSQVREMHNSAQVGRMHGSAQVGKMYDGSAARDFKGYPLIKLLVPDGGSCRFELTAHKNELTVGAGECKNCFANRYT
ncbi:hypothetical protein [Clostridium porci]|uniref:hypothetical protein n=1 Tax=Clostridium porci TaxID=2605778 RepID=UPI003A8DA441